MRIAVVVARFPALSETFILDQITGLIDRGHHVDIFANEAGHEQPSHSDVESYNLTRRTRYRPPLSANPLLRGVLAKPGAHNPRFDDGDAWGFFRDCVFTRDEARTYGAYNAGYSNPELDRLIEQGDLIFDRRERLAHYRSITRLALEEMPLVPLYARQDIYAVSDRVSWRSRVDGNVHVADVAWKDASSR